MINKVDAILSIIHAHSKAHPDLRFTEILAKLGIIAEDLTDAEVLDKMRIKLLTLTKYE
ncbi:MAG: hypothetical protein IPJ03_22440 [Ignavibacteriales bacterium]|nr:hypothetical protein [Ignavibacteriales bacterium]